jgi:phage protein D
MRTPLVGVISLVVASLAGQVVTAQNARLQATLGGAALPTARVVSIVVDGSTTDVDAATLTLDLARAKPPSIGDAVEVLGGASLFKGEVVGVEPVFDAGGENRVIVRALNKLHRLSRGRKSKTYENQTDAEIVSRIAGEAGLVAGPALPETSVRYDYIYQRNETDLEFLRQRAARIGFEVLVDDTKLLLRPTADPEPTPLGCAGQAPLRRFHPRLSSAHQVSSVTVRGWDPVRKQEIVGKATRRMIGLSPGAGKPADPPTELDLGLVQGLDSEASAYGAAKGTLNAITADDLAAEADADGSPALHAGAIVAISGLDARFNGKYYVVGVSHRYQPGAGGEWHTFLRIVRTDRGFYSLPEVDDEVLVAFEHGDITQPVIVGSFWNGTDKPPDRGDMACVAGTK